jgi:hypothetical protein
MEAYIESLKSKGEPVPKEDILITPMEVAA